MKSEIFNNGPISCGIQVTENFRNNYLFGIYSEFIELPVINHEVSVVGFGYDEIMSQEYWIVRNSWGTHWGEYGFFKISMYTNNLGIETDCIAGTPSFEKPEPVTEI